jgi:hypothetical protein
VHGLDGDHPWAATADSDRSHPSERCYFCYFCSFCYFFSVFAEPVTFACMLSASFRWS